MQPVGQSEWQLPLKHVPTHRDSAVGTRSPWKLSHLCYQQKMFGQVSSIRFSPQGEENTNRTPFVGCTSTNQLLMLRLPLTEGCLWNEQTSHATHSINFRNSGQLVALAVEGRVVIRSLEATLERQLRGHTRDVRDCVFVSNLKVASCSDDTTVRIWDIPGQEEITRSPQGAGHKDYVRSLAAVPRAEMQFASASYDHEVFLWDARRSMNTPVTQWGLDEQVEVVVVLPDGSFAAAAGDVVYKLDPRSSKPVLSMSMHTKTVTALSVCETQPLLLTSSLDGRVRFVNSKTFEVEATRKFGNPITAVGIHPSASMFAVGMVTGQVEVHQFEAAAGAEGEVDEDAVQAAGLPAPALKASEKARNDKLQKIRRQLLSFKYQRSLRMALYSQIPDVLTTTLQELMRRGALYVALSGHNDRTIVALLRAVMHLVDVPEFIDVCVAVLDAIHEIYASVAAEGVPPLRNDDGKPGEAPRVAKSFFLRELIRAQRRVGECVAALSHLQHSVGLMELVLGE